MQSSPGAIIQATGKASCRYSHASRNPRTHCRPRRRLRVSLIVTSPVAGLQQADTVERDGKRAVVERSLAASYSPVLPGDEARYRAFRASWLGNDPGSFAAIKRMIANTEMDRDFARIRCPTQVIAGTHDQLRPPEAVEPIARAIPGARYRVLETGQFMAVQTPQPVADAFAAFLAEVGN